MIIDSQIWKHDLKIETKNFERFVADIDFNSHYAEKENILTEYLDESLDEYKQIGNLIFIKLQKFTIYTSVIIRKLIEADKISEELLNKSFAIQNFKKVDDREITKWNAFEIEELYDIECPEKTNINLKNLSDRIIHSYHFIPKYNYSKIDNKLPDNDFDNWRNDGLEGFYFSSDKTKEKELFFIPLIQYIKAIKEIVSDFIVRKEYVGNILKVNSKNKSQLL